MSIHGLSNSLAALQNQQLLIQAQKQPPAKIKENDAPAKSAASGITSGKKLLEVGTNASATPSTGDSKAAPSVSTAKPVVNPTTMDATTTKTLLQLQEV